MSDIFSGLANLTKTVTDSLNTYELRKIGDKVQGYVMNFTEAETKVREATNEDPWGPTGPQMQEIAHMTFQYDAFPEIMGMLWKRMFQENKAAWRRVYKSLILLNYLLKNGSERIVSNARDHLFEMRSLEHYKYTDEKGKDQGINVRHRAKLVMELIQDEELLRAERRKAKTEGKEKYQGYSKEEMNMGRGGGSSNYDNRWRDERKSNYSDDFSSRDNDRDRDFSSPKREVTAFDFAESRHQTASPELGIRERTPEPQDDDEFGDFADARNTRTSGTSNAQKATFSTNGTSVSHIAPPTIPGPNAGGIKTVNAPQSTQNSANLLDFDFGPPAPQPDFFGSVSPQTNQNAVRPPRPPSGGPAQNSNTLDDLFGSPASNPAPAPKHSTSLDIFGDLTSPAPPAQPTPTPNLFGGFPTSSQAPTGNNIDLFGDFTSTPAQPQPSVDLFGSTQPVSNVPSSISAPNFMDFQSPLAPTQAQTLTPASGSLSARSTSSNPTPATKQDVKLPDTWAGVQGKLNIDLDNLSLRSPKKQSVPMNQLKAQNNNGLNW